MLYLLIDSLKRLALLVLTIVAVLPAPVHAEEVSRFALVIGNSKYETVTKLPNASRDAEGIAEALVRLQFKVYRGIDLTKAQFSKIIEDFKRDSESADTIVFYYAGHGFQLSGSNFLVPVDADLTYSDHRLGRVWAIDEIDRSSALSARHRQLA